MISLKILTPTLAEIMSVIWDEGRPMKRPEIQALMADKEWKAPTLNNFLNKLVVDGFLKLEHDRRDYVYYPLVSREDYLRFEVENKTRKVYGSIQNVLASFRPSEGYTDEYIQEIKDFIDKLYK